jgi:hypothetical protein
VNGCVRVASVDDVAGAVGDLLGAPERLELLASRGIATAAAEGAWEPYVARVDTALDAVKVADVPGHAAHAGLGAALRAETAALEAELAGTRAELERHRRWLEDTNSALSWRLTRPLRSAKRRLRGR